MTRLDVAATLWYTGGSLGRLQRGLCFCSHLRTTAYSGCQQSPRAVGFPRMSAQTAGGPQREGSVDSARLYKAGVA